MSTHGSRVVERHCDVVIVDASAAALAAAVELGRQRQSVIVLDADETASDPGAREEVRSHGGEILAGRVVGTTQLDDGRFRVELIGGNSIVAGRLLTGADAATTDLTLDETAGPSANEADWDHRYGAKQMWSGNPNGSLVNQVQGMAPGRALDVGAGEGGDAIWLAEHGWKVTASDISQRALDRITAEAARRGLDVECHHTDANARDAFEPGAFDLVSAQYASIPRTADDRAVHNLVNAVAPGGVLLVVSHDLAPMRQPIDTTTHSQAFDPDAYVRTDDFAAVVAASPDWQIELHDKHARPPGAISASHHVDDIIFRARRSA